MVLKKKTNALITPSWWVSPPKVYVWVSAQQQSQWCSQNFWKPFLLVKHYFFKPECNYCAATSKHQSDTPSPVATMGKCKQLNYSNQYIISLTIHEGNCPNQSNLPTYLRELKTTFRYWSVNLYRHICFCLDIDLFWFVCKNINSNKADLLHMGEKDLGWFKPM